MRFLRVVTPSTFFYRIVWRVLGDPPAPTQFSLVMLLLFSVSGLFGKIQSLSQLAILTGLKPVTQVRQTSVISIHHRTLFHYVCIIPQFPVEVKHYFMTWTVTVQTPWQPIFLAAPLERSRCLPLMNGPRSFTRTITDLPL
mgnify:CR=1 FL=1